MGWATHYITMLRSGATVQFRPRGNSMSPRIESGQLCTVKPVTVGDVRVNDVVLCRVHGREYLHIVKAIDQDRFQIGNNKGYVNGWIGAQGIYGVLVKVED